MISQLMWSFSQEMEMMKMPREIRKSWAPSLTRKRWMQNLPGNCRKRWIMKVLPSQHQVIVVLSEMCSRFCQSPRGRGQGPSASRSTGTSPARPVPTVWGGTVGPAAPAETCLSSEGGGWSNRAVSSGSASGQPRPSVPRVDLISYQGEDNMKDWRLSCINIYVSFVRALIYLTVKINKVKKINVLVN